MPHDKQNQDIWLISQKLFAIGCLLKQVQYDCILESEDLSASYGLGEIITSLSLALHAQTKPAALHNEPEDNASTT